MANSGISRSLSLLVVPGLVLLASCSTTDPKIDVSPQVLTKLKTVAVIRPVEPKRYVLMRGLITGGSQLDLLYWPVIPLIALDLRSKQATFDSMLKAKKASVTGRLTDTLSAKLSGNSYAVTLHDGTVKVDGSQLEINFSGTAPSFDALLVISKIEIGYFAPAATADYRPMIATVATLLGRDGKTVLYRGFHTTGVPPYSDGSYDSTAMVRLHTSKWRSSRTTRTFPDFDTLMRDEAATVNALLDAADTVADSIASDLAKKPQQL